MTNVYHSTEHAECLIWPGQPAAIRPDPGNPLLHVVERSHRVGTSYAITTDTKRLLEEKVRDDSDRAKLTTILLNLRRQGNRVPEVTAESIEGALESPSLTAAERAGRLITFMASKCAPIDETVNLGNEDHRYSALAWSGATSDSELTSILCDLQGTQLIKPSVRASDDPSKRWTITPDGYSRITELVDCTNSPLAFVAMSCNGSFTNIYIRAIAPAIRNAGYVPVRSDGDKFKITDEVIAQIRRSRFLVANFTQHPNMVRDDVAIYYATGLAHGLKIPVIFAAGYGVRPSFETSAYDPIAWRDEELPALQSALTERILGIPELGAGPFSG